MRSRHALEQQARLGRMGVTHDELLVVEVAVSLMVLVANTSTEEGLSQTCYG